ncbi:MAG: glycosyltransferase 87 family protein [Gemmatimonadota bacterium]|nr:glycosyltransferase 87 family protein [Gemmatimonadota bacterium]
MTKRQLRVRIALAATVAVGLLLAPEWLTTSDIVLRNDFFQYWSAGRFVLAGGNPYDHAAFFEFQKALGWENPRPILLWTPPWTVGLFLPFALLRYAPAMMAWLFVQGVLLVACARAVWRLAGGDPEGERGAIFAVLLFTPSVLTLWSGQLGSWLVVGLTLAMLGTLRPRPMLAGLALPLLALKPHFTFLLLLGLPLHALRRRRLGALLLGLGLGLGATLAVPLAFRPTLPGDYLATILAQQPRQFVSDTLGAGLRLLAGWDRFWVQFLPLVGGLAWLGREALRRPRDEDVPVDAIPLLALVSAFVAPYGWIFDTVTAIPALLFGWAGIRASADRAGRLRAARIYFAASALLMAFHVWLWDPMGWVHGWLPALLLAVYLKVRPARHRGAGEAPAVGDVAGAAVRASRSVSG